MAGCPVRIYAAIWRRVCQVRDDVLSSGFYVEMSNNSCGVCYYAKILELASIFSQLGEISTMCGT